MTAIAEVTQAYELVNAALQPLMKRREGGGDAEAARVAYGQLNLLKQWARVGASLHDAAEARAPKVKNKKRRA